MSETGRQQGSGATKATATTPDRLRFLRVVGAATARRCSVLFYALSRARLSASKRGRAGGRCSVRMNEYVLDTFLNWFVEIKKMPASQWFWVSVQFLCSGEGWEWFAAGVGSEQLGRVREQGLVL
jgi:hypothetical protein